MRQDALSRKIGSMSRIRKIYPFPVAKPALHMCREILFTAGWIVLISRPACAEPRISTTANRAAEIAPWPVWLLGIAVFAFVLYPLITLRVLRFLGVSKKGWLRGAIGLSLLHFVTGILTMDTMVLLSIGYINASPFLFIAAWLGLAVLITVFYCALARKYGADGLASV